MSSDKQIESLLETAIANIKEMVGTDTVVGEEIVTADGFSILPVSRVGCGFVTGGGQYGEEGKPVGNKPFGGGVGAGVSVKPVGFIISGDNQVRFIPVESDSPVDRILEALPGLMQTFQKLFNKDDEEKLAGFEIDEVDEVAEMDDIDRKKC